MHFAYILHLKCDLNTLTTLLPGGNGAFGWYSDHPVQIGFKTGHEFEWKEDSGWGKWKR
jgi:hypothetical protein